MESFTEPYVELRDLYFGGHKVSKNVLHQVQTEITVRSNDWSVRYKLEDVLLLIAT